MLRGDLQIQLLLEDLTGRVVAAQPARKQHAAPFEPELGVLLGGLQGHAPGIREEGAAARAAGAVQEAEDHQEEAGLQLAQALKWRIRLHLFPAQQV
eukprot:CAMPEP_0181517976 /NCGR_PEP_ID=MMETSP1110-20121109/65002_1 /TAXON_ID=174948 /ORGANISM="Symbiodinium sp., Strain CCMP421" /LENGTH=96 /DNA_ID=CAMNT_0023648311 /DNA_START=545 /DNA_END=831 /DNA_ORIENTATION=-